MIALATIILAGAVIVGVAWAALTLIWAGRQVDNEIKSDSP